MPKSGSGGHARRADGHRQWGVALVIGGLVAGRGVGVDGRQNQKQHSV